MYAAFPRSEYYQRIRLRTVAFAFLRNNPYRPAYSIRFVADQDHSGSPRSLDASLSERAVLTDPAAVSGHLAVYGVPTGASQPLRCCRPAVKYLTRLNRFYFRSGPRVALSTLSPIRYLLRPKTRFPVRRLHLLTGREFHPLEAPGLSWRTIMQVHVSKQRRNHGSLRRT